MILGGVFLAGEGSFTRSGLVIYIVLFSALSSGSVRCCIRYNAG